MARRVADVRENTEANIAALMEATKAPGISPSAQKTLLAAVAKLQSQVQRDCDEIERVSNLNSRRRVLLVDGLEAVEAMRSCLEAMDASIEQTRRFLLGVADKSAAAGQNGEFVEEVGSFDDMVEQFAEFVSEGLVGRELQEMAETSASIAKTISTATDEESNFSLANLKAGIWKNFMDEVDEEVEEEDDGDEEDDDGFD